MALEDLAPFPTVGRVHELAQRVGPASTTIAGRARLDAIADWLQQVAYDDVVAAGIAQEVVWVLRRNQIRVERFPVFGELLRMRTACSGLGPLVSERRTTITGDAGGRIEAAAIWVPLHPGTLLPHRSPAFLEVFGPSAAGRRVRARLRHPAPPADAPAVPWSFVSADLDVAGHVNNAATWRPLEEELTALPADAPLGVDLEHHEPAFAGPVRVVADGVSRWVTTADGRALVSAVFDREPGVDA
ncbi:acyl-ACP thioesterase domain-containing protein [Patulibacter minatonensis]|uniref:acyl-ACP thioesterase domain-containing protein n=1 Tax=Patulibacter minatonensis TaxID=298163 RepID=UPI00047B6EAF|nr:acyl-ACP thioesterase domain-containing protein [Patulibacter minatonensis]